MQKAILLVGLLGLTGCYQFHEAPLSPEQTLDDFKQRTLTSEEVSNWLGAAVPGAKGWRLHPLTKVAFYYHPLMREMRAHIREAQGLQTSAAERPNPVIGVRPGFNSTTPASADISPWILDLVIDWPIETMGKRRARMAQSDFQLEAARFNCAATAWELRGHIRDSLLKLYAARCNAIVLAARQNLLETGLTQFENRLAAGDVSAVDLQTFTMECERGKNEVAENQRQEREALAYLAQAIGVPVGALEGIAFDFSDFEMEPAPLPLPEARRRAVLNRADLLAALAEYNAAQMVLKEEVAKQYPDVQIGPGYSFDQSEDKWSLGISLGLPLLNRNQGAIESAEASRDAAAAVFLQRQELVVAEIELAVSDYDALTAQWRRSQTLEQKTANLMETTAHMVRLGEVSNVEALQVSLQHCGSRMALLQARIHRLDALGRLENAMQYPSTMEGGATREPSQVKGENG